ncbi:MAG: hypothetical protein LIO77_07500 [Rikenellaceae bacterium]|nr:hypothetical protein [Rikenellaceae bacterium]
MMNIVKKLTLTLALSALTVAVYGQQDFGVKWGATSEEQTENVKKWNFYKDAYNNKDYDQALELLEELIEGAPAGTQNLYIYGANIYKDRILKATSVADKNAHVEKLMELYDLRAQHFGDDAERGTAYILSLKADDYAIYRPMDRDNVIRYYSQAVDAAGDGGEPDFLIRYFNELTNDYKVDLVETDDYMAAYDKLDAVLSLPANQGGSHKNTLEALLISVLPDCATIESVYADRLQNNPDDVELMEKTVGLLARNKCDSDFFGEVGDRLYAVKPTAALAINLADYYDKKGQSARSLEYLNAAIANETDPENKLNLAIRISGSELSDGNARTAASFARQAIDINPESGLAYFFLAQAYAVGANQCRDFDRQAAFWIVYDTLSRAKSLLGNDNTVGDIDSMLARYRASFPSQEEGFFRGLSSGQSYTVNCGWVSGTTTVRFSR